MYVITYCGTERQVKISLKQFCKDCLRLAGIVNQITCFRDKSIITWAFAVTVRSQLRRRRSYSKCSAVAAATAAAAAVDQAATDRSIDCAAAAPLFAARRLLQSKSFNGTSCKCCDCATRASVRGRARAGFICCCGSRFVYFLALHKRNAASKR